MWVGRLSNGWFATRLLLVPMSFLLLFLALRGGMAVTIGPNAAAAIASLWVLRDTVRVARTPEPRFVVAADSISCAFAILGAPKRIPRSEIRVIKAIASYGWITIYATTPRRGVTIPWRWIVPEGDTKPSLAAAARKMAEILDVPAIEVAGFRPSRTVQRPLHEPTGSL